MTIEGMGSRGMRITKRSVEALRPRSIISDEEIKGFVAAGQAAERSLMGFDIDRRTDLPDSDG